MIDYLIRRDRRGIICIGINRNSLIFEYRYKFLRISKFGFDDRTLEFINELIESIPFINFEFDFIHLCDSTPTKIIIRELLETKKEVWINVKEGYYDE